MSRRLLILGASTRAAAHAALRADLLPWCADLFADLDLQACCATTRLAAGTYPHGFRALIETAPPGPWMYTGALENWGALVHKLAGRRPLWGNDVAALRRARAPWHLRQLLATAGLPSPVVLDGTAHPPGGGRWLVKPLRGSGGMGIRFWTEALSKSRKTRAAYVQEYLEGEACAAVYVADGRQARLLGVTRQLVGAHWLHAAPFHYCGSVGPLPLDAALRAAFERLGSVVCAGCRLRGLVGIDCILHAGVPWPVEVNPRYSASVEVLEHALGIPALALHRAVFEPTAPTSASSFEPSGPFLGKAILYARAPLTFPAEGPWSATLRDPGPLSQPPAFADIPHAGQLIEYGRPILTFFARAGSLAECTEELRRVARDLDHWLFGR